jgi:hypothetical protein
MDSWDIAYLVSGDADYVPAVASLRRRGKIVNGVGFSRGCAPALVRECYDYVDLCSILLDDIAAYTIFKEDGVAQKWLTDEVPPGSAPLASHALLELQFELSPPYYIWLGARAQGYQAAASLADFSGREKQVEEFKTKHPYLVEGARPEQPYYRLQLGPSAWESVRRRLGAFESLIEKSIGFPESVERKDDKLLFTAYYRYDRDAGRYERVSRDCLRE